MFANGIAMASPIPSARGAFFPLPLPLLPLAPAPRAPLSSFHSSSGSPSYSPPPLGSPSPPPLAPFPAPPFGNVLYLRSGFSSPPPRPSDSSILPTLSPTLRLSSLSRVSPLPFVRHLPPSLPPPRTRATVLSHVQVTLISCATNLADQNWILAITAWKPPLFVCIDAARGAAR